MRRAMLAGVVLALACGVAEARPNYNKEFAGVYSANTAAVNAKCAACHEGEDKKNRNNYGEAVGKAIGGKSEKDADKIKAAFKKVEGEKSAVAGKTFGDLLKDGKLPSSK